MKNFAIILAGFFAGNVLCLNLSRDVNPQEAGIYLSFLDNLVLSAVVSFFCALVFWGFMKLFNVQAKNYITLFLVCFAVQIITWAVLHVSPFDFGMLGFLVAILVFSALANYSLDKIL